MDTLEDIWPPFAMDHVINGRDERLARYTIRYGDRVRDGVCVATRRPDGGVNLLIGETARRIRYLRMTLPDSDRIVRAWTGLVPAPGGLDGPLSVNYRLPGRVIDARLIDADEATLPDAPHTIARQDDAGSARTPAPAGPAARAGQRRPRWPRADFPNAAVHPYTHTGRDGRRWDMMGVTIPEGVRLQDVDLGGWRLSAFADRRSSADKANGGPVTISFRPGRPVDLYRGRGPGRETMRIDDPWDLCCAVKAGQGQRAGAPAPPRTPADDMFADYGWHDGIDIMRGEHYTIPDPGMAAAVPPAHDATR